MSYEFLKTEYRGEIEVAYLLDKEGGRVVIVPVQLGIEGTPPVRTAERKVVNIPVQQVDATVPTNPPNKVSILPKNFRPKTRNGDDIYAMMKPPADMVM